MDNLEDKFKYNTNSTGENSQFHPDPTVHAKDVVSKTHHGIQHTEIINKTKEPLSITDARFPSNQFMGTGGPSQPLTPATDITDILKSMYRFKWMILAIFILATAPAITAIWMLVVPKHQAKAEVRIRPIIPTLVFRTEDNGMIPLYSSYVNTQVAILKSSSVLQRVLDEPAVQETQWYKHYSEPLLHRLLGKPVPSHIERLKSALDVKPRRRTEITDVTFEDFSPKDAKIVLDTVLGEYLKYVEERSDEARSALHNKLLEEYKSLETEITGREDFCASLSKSLGTSTPEALVTNKKIRLDETEAKVKSLQYSIALLETERNDLENLTKQAIPDDSNNVLISSTVTEKEQPKYYGDPEWRGLDRNARNIRYKIATSLFTPKHPDSGLMKKELEFAEELLQLREAQLDEQFHSQSNNEDPMPFVINNSSDLTPEERLKSIEFQLNQARQEEKFLNDDLQVQKIKFDSLFEQAQLLEKENNRLMHKRGLFSAVRQRLDQKNIERNVPGSISVLTWGFSASQPSNDPRIISTAIVLVIGLGLSGGTAFLKAYRSQSMYTYKDMPYPMQAPFLGYIPACNPRRSPENDEFNPSITESIRVVRTALLSRLNSHVNTTVLVTSAEAATGKSTFTMMLGKSLAQAGKKVLIIDGDFRKITLTKRFNLQGKSGFLESLSRKSADKRHIFPTEIFGLSVMPAGKKTSNGMVFEETANGAFKACIGQLRKQFNIILLDSSPILPVADAAILSSQVDGTIMVERELVSRRENVITALARLGSAGGRILGTVFVSSESNKGYGYNYSYSRTSES
ncbi:MAG: polysaccharide biosynthesis tyrosine autokinase [Planctomycetes bacterium]|nr:polysaccharide biosynthesis tyrosine autokinase [Planctomycetota bacterium]